MNSEIGDEVEKSLCLVRMGHVFKHEYHRDPVMPKFCRKICCIFALSWIYHGYHDQRYHDANHLTVFEDDADCRSFEALLSEGNDFVASAEFSGVARAEQEARNMAKLLIGSSVSMMHDTRKTYSKTSPGVYYFGVWSLVSICVPVSEL